MTSASACEKKSATPSSTEVPGIQAIQSCTSHDTVSSGDEDGKHACQDAFGPEALQQKVVEASQVVLDMWPKLNALEAAVLKDLVGASPTNMLDAEIGGAPKDTAKKNSPTDNMMQPPAPISIEPSRYQEGRKSSMHKHAGTACFVPMCNNAAAYVAEHNSVLAAAARSVDAAANVLDTKIFIGTPGTLAILTIRMLVNSEDEPIHIGAIAKAALLEAAASSTRVYVLGYEAFPFADDPCGTGFSGTLAINPCEQSTCWEAYSKACCPRGMNCRWRHPARHELQPIRVVFDCVRPFDGKM